VVIDFLKIVLLTHWPLRPLRCSACKLTQCYWIHVAVLRYDEISRSLLCIGQIF